MIMAAGLRDGYLYLLMSKRHWKELHVIQNCSDSHVRETRSCKCCTSILTSILLLMLLI